MYCYTRQVLKGSLHAMPTLRTYDCSTGASLKSSRILAPSRLQNISLYKCCPRCVLSPHLYPSCPLFEGSLHQTDVTLFVRGQLHRCYYTWQSDHIVVKSLAWRYSRHVHELRESDSASSTFGHLADHSLTDASIPAAALHYCSAEGVVGCREALMSMLIRTIWIDSS